LPTRALISTAATLAALAVALLAASAAHAGLRTVPGTAVRAVHGARVVGSLPGSIPLDVAVTLRPRNAALLDRLAASSSASTPLSPSQVAALFYPTRSQVAAVRRYLTGRGLSFRAEQGLSLVFHGTSAAAERAFGVHLALYRRADGRVFHAPTGPARLPSTLAGQVVAVEGLDDAARVHPAAASHVSPASPPCAGASAFEAGDPTAYLPSELAAAGAYDFQSLLDGGYDGTGESMAFVEFSNYNHADLAAFDACYGLSVPRTDVPVAGGTTDTSGALEVELDLEEIGRAHV